MVEIENKYKLIFRLIDISILSIAFYLSYLVLESAVTLGANIYLITSAYALISFILIRFSKLFTHKCVCTQSLILKSACSNACGLSSSVFIIAIISFFIPKIGDIVPLAIISSIASFFVLGTVVPAIRRILEVRERRLKLRKS